MKIISADETEKYNLDWSIGTLRVVEDNGLRVILLLEEKTNNVIVVSIKEVK